MKKNLHILNRESNNNLLFVICLIGVYFFYNYHEILFLRPQGIHFIRQTDSLAFVTGYYKYGMNFFEPKGLNLISEGGKGVSEFPILYYITACLYFIFGENEFILRGLNILIVSSGFYFLFKLMKNLLQDVFYSFVLTFLFLSSTILMYYTNNFLPDASALGFTLIGWYYFYNYLTIRKSKSLVFCFLFFTIASLLKVTFLISPIAAFLTLIFIIKEESSSISLVLKIFSTSLLINLIWISYVVYYNHSSGNNYFTTTIRPIWNLSDDSIANVWDSISNYWYTKYYFQSTFHLLFFVLLIGLLMVKRIFIKLLLPACFLFLGSLCFIVLFYEMFKDHDYYFITVLPAIIMVVLACFQGIYSKYPKLIKHFLIKFVFLAICVLSINYSQVKLSGRYIDSKDELSDISEKFVNVNSYIQKIGIDEFSKVVVVQDISRNGSLYFLNRQGWVLKDYSKLNTSVLLNFIDDGAEYLIFLKKHKVVLQPNLIKEIGEINGMIFYKLRSN
ncbi:MAG: hypothetical protein COB15_15925 [Flavobacteriales bacterium]|nr:MAG: hypothetical protein COB15_15925 [Flavobacteriales bacterium]